MPYKDKEKAKARRKKYYEEIEKPRREKEKKLLLKEKMKRKIRRKKQVREAREYAWKIKKDNKCSNCMETDPACLIFHHIDPSKKRASIHKLYKYGLGAVKKEIKKCKLLCANCHMKFHYYEAKDGEGVTASVENIEKNT